MKKPPQKVAYLSRNSVVSEFFFLTAQQSKWQNSCSQMWSIEQLYIELGYIPTWSSIREKSCKIFWSFYQIETKIMKSSERRKLWLQWGQNQDANTFSSVCAQRAAACFEILVISSETRTKRPSQPPSFSWLVKQHECFTYLFLWLKSHYL